MGLISGLVAGIYPAFYLSSFNPSAVLKVFKLNKSGGAVFLRKGLVTGQFAASLILFFATIIIYQQIQYVKSRDMGYSGKGHILYVELQGALGMKFHALRDELISQGVASNAALSGNVPLAIGSNSDNFKWSGSNPSQNISITVESVSPEYTATMDMKILQGRDFYSAPKVDSSNVIINESMAKLMGTAGHIGGIITDGGGGRYQIVGIIRDFLYNDMYADPGPLMLFCNPENTGYLNIRFGLPMASGRPPKRSRGSSGSSIPDIRWTTVSSTRISHKCSNWNPCSGNWPAFLPCWQSSFPVWA